MRQQKELTHYAKRKRRQHPETETQVPSSSCPCSFVSISTAASVILLAACLALHYSDSPSLEFLHRRSLQVEDGIQHKPLLPFSSRDMVGFTLASLGLMLAAGGGIGGGGLLVPIYILIFKFPAKNAIPLSNVTVFGGAVANTMFNCRKRHPLADRPLIDWSIILNMEPLTILGSLFGTNLNKLLRETVIVVLLVVLLSLTAYKTLAKAIKLHQTETYAQVQCEIEENIAYDKELDLEMVVEMKPTKPFPPKRLPLTRGLSDSINFHQHVNFRNTALFRRSTSFPQSILRNVTNHFDVDAMPISRSAENTSQKRLESESSLDLDVQARTNSMQETLYNTAWNPELARILEQERHTPALYVCYIGTLFLFVLTINILKGGGALESPLGIECGSLSFWIAQATMVLVICAVSYKARSALLYQTRLKRDAGYQCLDCDIEWNEMSTCIYPLLSWTAGFVAGLFGIGGGIIKGPLMLALGVHPAVASATSACMILFTSLTATTSFAVFGLLIFDYGVFGLLTGFFATILGQTIMAYLIHRYERSSYIAFCIGGVVFLSAICMTVESVISIRHGGELSARSSSLCSTHF